MIQARRLPDALARDSAIATRICEISQEKFLTINNVKLRVTSSC